MKIFLKKYFGFLKFASKKSAFSLIETIIATSLVGAISVLAVHWVNGEITTRVMDTKRLITHNDIAVALADMQSEDSLSGYTTQNDFKNAFNKKYQIQDIPKNEMAERFASQYKNSDGSTFSANDYKNRVVTSDGVSIAFTYDTKYESDSQFVQDNSLYRKVGNNYSYVAKNKALEAIDGFIDINGARKPNVVGKDVMLISAYSKDCKDKDGNLTGFIPNAAGKCPNESKSLASNNICPMREMNCKANGSNKTLDKGQCKCVCKISCPIGTTKDEKNCVCLSCDFNSIENTICKTNGKENPYADCAASKASCGCVPKVLNADKVCSDNGGEWNPKTCRCICKSNLSKEIKDKYNNLAVIDKDNFCKPKCKYSKTDKNFTGQVGLNAKKVYHNNTKIINEAKNITLASADIDEYCFVCSEAPNSSVTYVKNTESGNGGFCSSGCNNTPSEKEKAKYGKYFTFVDYDPNDPNNSCKWTCKSGENEGIKKYVKELNEDSKYAKYRSPIIMDKGTEKESLDNFKLAQWNYFKAALVGKTAANNLKSKGKDIKVTENGRNYTIRRPERCYNFKDRSFSCQIIYDEFKNNNSKFAGFLKYVFPDKSPAPAFAFGFPKDPGNDYKMFYTPDLEHCTVVTNGFNVPNRPVDSISYHGSGIVDVNEDRAVRVIFTYDKVKNSKSKTKYDPYIPNPNRVISAPKEFLEYDPNYNKYSDDYWKKIPVGVSIGFKSKYDPLALNVGSNPMANPVSGKSPTKLPIVYNEKTKSYSSIDVYMPINKNGSYYKFIVNKSFYGGNKNIGNMFSDQVSWDKIQYATGFDQLKAQYDNKTRDNIITRDELKDLYLWNKGEQTEFTPLTDFVLDINLYMEIAYNETGNALQDDKVVYDIAGSYRKLIRRNSSGSPCANAANCSGGAHINYIGYNRNGLDNDLKTIITGIEGTDKVLELWQDLLDSNIYYYTLRHKYTSNNDIEPTDYPTDSSGWSKIKMVNVANEIIDNTLTQIPNDAVEINSTDAPQAIQDMLNKENLANISLYQKNNYYYVKETTANENQESTTSIKKYEYVKYKDLGISNDTIKAKYFYENNIWYDIITAKITDIIFKYEK